jgi:flagellar basal body-associated protein FliL
MMTGKLKIILPLALLVALGVTYKVALAGPGAEAKPKVDGKVYVLPKEFLINLSDERFAKVNVALVMDPDQEVESGEGVSASPPEGFGPLSQEAVVRDIVTDTLTDLSADELVNRSSRDAIKRRLKRAIRSHTDVDVEEVLLTDVAIQ